MVLKSFSLHQELVVLVLLKTENFAAGIDNTALLFQTKVCTWASHCSEPNLSAHVNK